MLSDSPYDLPEAVLPLPAGALMGGVGAVAMVAVAAVWHSAARYLEGVAAGFVPAGRFPAETMVIVGVGVHVVVGGLLGLAYASSQRRAPTAALLASGIAFGVLLWVVGRIVVLVVDQQSVRETVRSWAWLAACVTYGEVLALAAALWQRLRPPAQRVVIRD